MPQHGQKAPKGIKGAWPPADDYPVISHVVKVGNLSGSLLENVKGGSCVGTVGVWSAARNSWVVPPMVVSIIVDTSTFHYPDILSFILAEDSNPTKESFDLKVELTEKKMLRTHKLAQITIPLSQLGPLSVDSMTNASFVNLTGKLQKPESKHNPEDRGTLACRVELQPLTYLLDLNVFFKELPHNINFWVIFFTTADDSQRPPMKKNSADKYAGRSNLDRFRVAAVRLQAQHTYFNFGEAPLSQLEHIRKGTKAALQISHTSDFGKPQGQIVAICGNENLTFGLQEAYEHRLRSFLSQFRLSSTSGSWSRAVEVLKQLNPSVMVDVDLDNQDFGLLSSLSTLFRTVGEDLLHGGRQARIKCLQELAIQAPQALCSIALHVPFDIFVRELDGVLYDSVGAGRSSVEARGSLSIAVPKREHSWHGDKIHVSPSSPRAHEQAQAASGPTRGSVMSALYRAGNVFGGRKRENDNADTGWEGTGSSSLHSSHDANDGSSAQLDRTWHGTIVSPEQVQSGMFQYSAVPRHGALRLPPSKPYCFEGMQLMPRAGMLDALHLLSGVLGSEFLVNFTMPCLRHKDVDKVQLARLVGQLHYSAMTAGCDDAAKELRKIHLTMLNSADELQQVNSIKSLPDFARYDSAAVAQHVEQCCRTLLKLLCDQSSSFSQHTRLHLLDSFVCIVPSFVRRLDEDHLQNEIGVGGGAALRTQVQHAKSLQGLETKRITCALHDAVCTLLEAAIKARQKSVDDAAASKSGPSLPPIPAAPDREDLILSGLWLSSNAEAKAKRTLEERYVDAARALARMCQGEQHSSRTADPFTRAMGPWRTMIECKWMHPALVSGLAALSRLFLREVPPGQWEPAPKCVQEVLKLALETCTEKNKDLKYDEKCKVCSWSWSHQLKRPSQAVKLHCQLPIILTAIEREWEGRLFWLHAMKAAYNCYLAGRRVELADSTWSISEDGSKIEIPGAAEAFDCSLAIIDPLLLAYQLPGALRVLRESQLDWPEALVVFKCMSEDENADVRWMLSHAIHCYPPLFGPDCAPVLVDTFERLLRDDDLDVAEGVHKYYMAFVSQLALVDKERGALLADMFLDHGLWERRLHFAVFQSAHLEDYIKCGLVDVAREEAGDAIKLLLRHSCTTVRKNAAKSMVRLLPRAGEGGLIALGLDDKLLLDAVVLMSTGTCRERQTFVWACEVALVENIDVLKEYFLEPLEMLVESWTREAGYGDQGRVEPTYYRSACNILKRHSDGPAAASTAHFSNVSTHNVDSSPIMTRSHHSRIPVNRLPQHSAQDDPDFKVYL